jgi:hypothetical protein
MGPAGPAAAGDRKSDEFQIWGRKDKQSVGIMNNEQGTRNVEVNGER